MRPMTNRRAIAAVAGAALLSSLPLAGCGVIGAVNKITHAVQNNKAIIDAFTGKLKNGGATPFEATYVTTGSAPATIVYAVQPPHGLLFKDTATGGSSGALGADIIANPAGEFACSAPGTVLPHRWSCQRLGKASAAVQNKVFDFYTPAHWVAFLNAFALAAGVAGDKVTSSTMTVNGFTLSCVDFRAAGISGTSTICSTAQGILGYVKVAGDSTSFQIKSFTTSPPASLFQLPKGAKVTKK